MQQVHILICNTQSERETVLIAASKCMHEKEHFQESRLKLGQWDYLNDAFMVHDRLNDLSLCWTTPSQVKYAGVM